MSTRRESALCLCAPSPSSAAPTWASPRCSTASSASGARSSTRRPGVTRDRIIETTDWAGHPFHLLDTGGIIPFGETIGEFDEAVTQIARDAIEEADVVLFMVDGQVGPMAWDDADRARPARRAASRWSWRSTRSRRTATELAAARVLPPGPRRTVRHQRAARRGRGRPAGRGGGGFPAQELETPCDCKRRHPRPPQRGQVAPAEPAGRPRGGAGQRDPRHHARLHPHRPELVRPDHPPDRHRRPAAQAQGQGGDRVLQQPAHHPRARAVRRRGADRRRRRGRRHARTPRSPA